MIFQISQYSKNHETKGLGAKSLKNDPNQIVWEERVLLFFSLNLSFSPGMGPLVLLYQDVEMIDSWLFGDKLRTWWPFG